MKKFHINDEGDVEFPLDKDHTLFIVATDEGIVLDVWPKENDEDGTVWSIYHFFNEMLPEEEAEKPVKQVKLSKDMPKHIRKRLKKRKDGRWQIKRCDLPRFADGTDHLPNPVEIDGRQKQWVGIGWTDHGPATGKEPLVIVEDE